MVVSSYFFIEHACSLLMKSLIEYRSLKDYQKTKEQIQISCNELNRWLPSLTKNVLEEKIEFILLPLLEGLPSFIQFKTKIDKIPTTLLSDLEIENFLNIIQKIIIKCDPAFIISRPDIYVKLIDPCLAIIDESFKISFKEETKLIVLKTLQTLFTISADIPDFNNNIYVIMITEELKEKNVISLRGLFMQIILVLLETSKKQQLREIQVQSLLVLDSLVNQVGRLKTNIVQEILPGITRYLLKIIISDFKTASRVRTKALETWRLCILLAFCHNKEIGPYPTLNFSQALSISSQETTKTSEKIKDSEKITLDNFMRVIEVFQKLVRIVQ